MSQYWAGYQSDALVLKEREYHDFLKKYASIHPETENLQKYMDDELDITEVSFLKSCGSGEFEVVEVHTDYCDGMYFTPFRREDGSVNKSIIENGEYVQVVSSFDMREDNCYIIEADHQLDSVRAFEQRPYDSYEQFVQEFTDKMESYLPDDFDWDAHLGIFSYAQYA